MDLVRVQVPDAFPPPPPGHGGRKLLDNPQRLTVDMLYSVDCPLSLPLVALPRPDEADQAHIVDIQVRRLRLPPVLTCD